MRVGGDNPKYGSVGREGSLLRVSEKGSSLWVGGGNLIAGRGGWAVGWGDYHCWSVGEEDPHCESVRGLSMPVGGEILNACVCAPRFGFFGGSASGPT